jgi:Trypsin-like peptidase domain
MPTPAEVVEQSRPSIVSVESAIGRGSGYTALANGVITTSQRVVGYEREVLVTTDEGATFGAFVVRVNVALDIALLIPTEDAKLVPITLASEPPKLGDQVVLLGHAGAEALAISSTVSAAERAFDGLPHMQIDATPDAELCGGAVVDASGRLVGSLVRPRRRDDGTWMHNLVLPLAAFEGGLMSVDGPADQIAALVPEYGCPRCDTVFDPTLDRCLECGVLLPHPWSEAFDPSFVSIPQARTSEAQSALRLAHYFVRVALGSIGVEANRTRVAPGRWRFSAGGDPRAGRIDLSVDDAGESLVLDAQVATIPDTKFEPFFRHLLTQNGDTLGPYRLGVRGAAVVLSAFEPVTSISATTFPQRVRSFMLELERCQESLSRFFGAEPING